jgi:hypothetical protein
VHSQEDEGFYVLEGEITFTVSGERVGTPHSFKNESDRPSGSVRGLNRRPVASATRTGSTTLLLRHGVLTALSRMRHDERRVSRSACRAVPPQVMPVHRMVAASSVLPRLDTFLTPRGSLLTPP